MSKNFGSTIALRDVDLVIEPGEIAALLGPNGAGKSTLPSVVVGLRRPDAGRVRIGGIDVISDGVRARSMLGYAPQELEHVKKV